MIHATRRAVAVALTVAVVTKPFEMEGSKRSYVADHGISELGKYCDSLITIPNEKLITVLGRDATMMQAFRAAGAEVLAGLALPQADEDIHAATA